MHRCISCTSHPPSHQSGTIDYVEWISFLDPRHLGGLTPKFRSAGLPTLTQTELERVDAMIARLETLAEAASRLHVKLMVDAEQVGGDGSLYGCGRLMRQAKRDMRVFVRVRMC